jgi:hypothetical protein
VIDHVAWEKEVAKAIVQLVQEVHALDPGVTFYCNLDTILSVLPEEERGG